MKKPYLTQFERQLISYETLTGDLIMLRFRWMQFLRSIEKSLMNLFIAMFRSLPTTYKIK